MKDAFKVHPNKGSSKPGYGWIVDGKDANGKRTRQYFRTKPEAEHHRLTKNAERRATGLKGILSHDQRVEAEEAFRRCREAGKSLSEVVEVGLAHFLKTERSVTVLDAYEHMMAAKRDRGRPYLTQLKNMLARFVAAYGDRRMAEFTTVELDDFISGFPGAPKSRNNLRGYIGTLWSHAVKKGLTKDNPAKDTSLALLEPKETEILTPAACRAMLAAAKEICPKSIPPLAIQAFAGLRSAEVSKLDWSEVSLEEMRITVTAGKAKTRTRRTVPISANLAAFLSPYWKPTGRITEACHRVEFPKIRAAVAACGHDWGVNALRHSFASYRLAETDDENKTALEAGHTPTMLHRHYKGLAKKSAAAEWWAILPDSGDGGNIVSMPAPKEILIKKSKKIR